MMKIYVSPARVIDTIILYSVVIIGIIAVIVLNLTEYFSIEVLVSLGVAIFVYASVITIFAFLSRNGLIYVTITGNSVTSSLLGKEIVSLNFESVKTVIVVRSINYGLDYKAVYMILSEGEIKKNTDSKPFSVYETIRKNIIIRITARNYETVKEKLKGFLPADKLPNSFIELQRRAAI